MATQYIYVLKRKDVWGSTCWKDGSELKESIVQSRDGAIQSAEHWGYEVQAKGHDYIIYVEQPDGRFALHRKSPGAVDEDAYEVNRDRITFKVPD